MIRLGPALALALLPCLTAPAAAPPSFGTSQQTTSPERKQPARQPDIFFAPSWEPVVYEMLELAAVRRDDVVYDLGSGDGRIVILAAQKYGARGVGIELDPKLVTISNQVASAAGLEHLVRFVEGDLFAADISPATVVTLYLSTAVNRDLEPKLRRELAPGTRIVTHQFPIGNWPPAKTVRSSEDGTELFLWTVGPVQ
jgi:SAM-dependent methyltransferase